MHNRSYMCNKPPSFVMPFHEDGHMSGRKNVEAYIVCEIYFYILTCIFLVLISQSMRYLYGNKKLQHTKDNFYS